MLVAMFALIVSCTPSGEGEFSVQGAGAGIVVKEVRAHALAGGTGALYFTVENGGASSDQLLRVATPRAEVAEIHETVDDQGVMRMVERAEGLAVPAEGSLVAEPGGKHVMLLGFEPGERTAVEVTFHFEHAGVLELQAPVIQLTGSPDAGHGKHGDHDEHGAHSKAGEPSGNPEDSSEGRE
jgi:hypothetical protein